MTPTQPAALRMTAGIGICWLVSLLAAVPMRAGNYLQESEALERWTSFRGARVVANAGTAPDHSGNADQVYDSTTENGARLFSNTIVASGGPYVFSCYLKAGTLRQARLTIADGNGSSVRAYVEPSLTDTWQRYTVSLPSSPQGSTLRVEIYPGKYDKDAGYVWAWGAQFESGTTSTPYAAGGTTPTADTVPPAVPTGLSAQLSGSTVQVRWSPNAESDLAAYRLQRSVNGGSFSSLPDLRVTEYLDQAVAAGSTYVYRLAAVDQTGNTSAFTTSNSVSVPQKETVQVVTGKNLIQYPEEFEKWGSFRESTAVANAGAAPTGAVTADQVVDSRTQNGGYLYSNSVVSEGGSYTLSCYLRAGTLGTAKLALFDVNGGSVRGFVEPALTSGWQRYTVTASNVPKGSLIRAGLYAGKFDREEGYVWAWGAQLEAGATATAYSSSAGTDGTTDTTPPAIPSGLSVQLSNAVVQVRWNANTEPDLARYRLERSTNAANSYAAVYSSTTPAYTDAAIATGNSYSYRVCAVDTAGNVSALSPVVAVLVPSPTPIGALSVVNFGANPAVSGDDTSAIQATFDAAAQQGRDVYLPAGHYQITRTVVFRAGGRMIFGDGMTRTTVAGDTNSYNLIQLDRTRGAGVRDLRLQGSHLNDDTRNTNRAIDCYATVGSLVRRVHSYGAGYLAFDNGGTNTTIEDSVIEDYGRIGYLANDGAIVRRCRFVCRESWSFSGEMHGIYASAGRSNVLIEDNEFINCGAYAVQLWGSQSGVWTENVLIQRNTFTRCKNVLVVGAGSSGPSYRSVRFVGNTIRQSQEKDIRIMKFNGSTANGTELLIEGNTFEDPASSYGFMIINYGGAPITGVRIRNNQFLCPSRSSYQGLLHLQASEAALSDIIIEGNLFQDFGHSGTTEKSFPAVWLRSGTGIQIQDNTFVHWAGAGQATDVEGVRWEVGAQNVQVTRNVFQGNGRPRCYGVRVTGAGGSANGSITQNQFLKARLQPNGVPQSGNLVQ